MKYFARAIAKAVKARASRAAESAFTIVRPPRSRFLSATVFTALLFFAPATVSACAAVISSAPPSIGTVKIQVGDVQRAIEFYRRLFGMQVTGHIETPYPPSGTARLVETELHFASSAAAPAAIPLKLMFRPDDRIPYRATSDLPAFVVIVPDMNDLMVRAADEKADVYIKPFDVSPKITAALIKDPSGNVIECVEVRL